MEYKKHMHSFWQAKNVFVTGANGFVGGWLTKELVKEEANVVALVRDWNPKGGLYLHGIDDKIIRISGNITDASLVSRILNEYEIDTCFHLAAQSLVTVTNRYPVSTFESNICGTWTLLEQCRKNDNVQRILITTSDKVYGTQNKLELKEDDQLLGLFPYDASKVCADVISRSYAIYYNLPISVVRFSNIYGGGDLNFSRIIPYTIKCAIFNQPVFLRSDGTNKREFIYIEDAVSALLMLAANMHREEIRGQAFNFGSGEITDVLTIIEKIKKISGRYKLKVIIPDIPKKGEINELGLDHQKASKNLSWQSLIGLESGLEKTFCWYQDYFN